MPSDPDQQSETLEPTAEDWSRAALELNSPPSDDYPTGLVVWKILNAATVIVVLVLLFVWLVRKLFG